MYIHIRLYSLHIYPGYSIHITTVSHAHYSTAHTHHIARKLCTLPPLHRFANVPNAPPSRRGCRFTTAYIFFAISSRNTYSTLRGDTPIYRTALAILLYHTYCTLYCTRTCSCRACLCPQRARTEVKLPVFRSTDGPQRCVSG